MLRELYTCILLFDKNIVCLFVYLFFASIARKHIGTSLVAFLGLHILI